MPLTQPYILLFGSLLTSTLDTAFDGNHSQAPAPEISSQAKSKANPNSHSTLDQNGQQWGPTAPMFDPAANPSSRQDPTPAFTSPETGISFTHEELKDLMEGKKINERGDKVYFKPGFVTNDPWARLRGNQQNKE